MSSEDTNCRGLAFGWSSEPQKMPHREIFHKHYLKINLLKNRRTFRAIQREFVPACSLALLESAD